MNRSIDRIDVSGIAKWWSIIIIQKECKNYHSRICATWTIIINERSCYCFNLYNEFQFKVFVITTTNKEYYYYNILYYTLDNRCHTVPTVPRLVMKIILYVCWRNSTIFISYIYYHYIIALPTDRQQFLFNNNHIYTIYINIV